MYKCLKLMLITVASLCISINIAYANDYFRSDSRSPDEIRRSGGLLPKGQYEAYDRGTPLNINLFDHARGTSTGNTRYDDGYVSTASNLRDAHLIGQNMLGGLNEYYIYVIAPAPNMFNVNEVLGRYSPFPYENEVAALGGIPFTQIIGWYRVNFGVIDGSMSRNPSFRRDLFAGLHIAPAADGYRLAGFPDGHQAWRESPWREHAPAPCASDLRGFGGVTCEAITNGLSKNRLRKIKEAINRKNALIYNTIIDSF